MAANPTAFLFYGILLDPPAAADLSDDDSYVAIEEALEDLGVEILHYGETPDQFMGLAIDASVITASNGLAMPVTSLAVGDDWNDRIERARGIVELPVQRAAWYVASAVNW